jgi:DNA-binding response OmpR family regulator
MAKKILIVEDDKLLADVYLLALKTEGLKATSAYDYNSAMKLFEPNKISLVVLDIILKGKNGFELLRDFRKQPGGDKVPIIIITGMNTQDLNMDRELMVSLNIIGIHTKSQFSIADFSGIIKSYLNKHEAV